MFIGPFPGIKSITTEKEDAKVLINVVIMPYCDDNGTPFPNSENNMTTVDVKLLSDELAKDNYKFVSLNADGILTIKENSETIYEEWIMRQEGEGVDNLRYTDCLGGFEFVRSHNYD